MNKDTNKGFTLIEIMMVVAVIAILAVVLIPASNSFKRIVKKVMCDDKCGQVEMKYELYLDIEKEKHSEGAFINFLENYENVICPGGGEIEYWDGKVHCSIHSKGEESGNDDEDSGSVPFL